MAGQQSVNHYRDSIELNAAWLNLSQYWEILCLFTLYTKSPYKSCSCATEIIYMLLVYSVQDNLMIHSDIQDKKFLHIWHLLLYERRYFLHGQQTSVSILSTIKTVFVCFSFLSSLKWQPHPLQPKGTQHHLIYWSPCPWLCPLCALWPPYHQAPINVSHCFLPISGGGWVLLLPCSDNDALPLCVCHHHFFLSVGLCGQAMDMSTITHNAHALLHTWVAAFLLSNH